jgi:hypothetical protein
MIRPLHRVSGEVRCNVYTTSLCSELVFKQLLPLGLNGRWIVVGRTPFVDNRYQIDLPAGDRYVVCSRQSGVERWDYFRKQDGLPLKISSDVKEPIIINLYSRDNYVTNLSESP